MLVEEESVHEDAARPDVQHILKDRARQKLPPRIKDPATLDRIAQLIEGAAPAQKKKPRGRRAA